MIMKQYPISNTQTMRGDRLCSATHAAGSSCNIAHVDAVVSNFYNCYCRYLHEAPTNQFRKSLHCTADTSFRKGVEIWWSAYMPIALQPAPIGVKLSVTYQK